MDNEEQKQDLLDTGNNNDNTDVVDKFPETTNFLSQEGLEEKKDLINNILKDENLRKGFESFLKSVNLRQKLKVKKELQNCQTEDEIKAIIAENIPGGYKIGKDIPQDESGKNKLVDDNIDLHSERRLAEENEEIAGQKKEMAEENEEIAGQKKEMAKENEKIAGQKKEMREIVVNIEKSNKIIREAMEYRQKLIDDHPNSNLKAKTGPESDLYKKTKTKLESDGVIAQLKKQLNDQVEEKDKDKKEEIINKFVDDYILVQATYQEVKNNTEEYSQEEISTFSKIVKNLENSCNIADTTSDSFSSKNISKTRTEMFNSDIGNDNLIKARDANKESNDYSNVFPEGEADIVRMYGKFVPVGAKKYVEEYNKHLADNTIDQYRNTQECQDLIKYLEQTKKSVDNKTKEFVEEMCILSQIKGMSMCIGEESENKFSLNKAREIEDKDGEITLKGHIDGVDIAIRHNSKDSNAHLETSSKFIKSDKDTFTISKEGKFSPSNFILPGQKEVFDTVTQRVKDSMKSGGILDKAGNRDEFLAAMNGDLQSDIVGDMENLYKDTALVHHYMKNKVRGEKIVNNSLSHIQKVKPNIDFTQPISPNSNAKLYPYFKIINFNIENSTAEEKNKLNDIISEIGKIINNYKNGTYDKDFKYPEIIENYLRNDVWKGGDEEKKFGKISDLFTYYSNKSKDNRFDREGDGGTPSKMVINDLYRDLFDSRNGKSPVAGEWQEEYNKEHAESDLEAQLSDSKDFPPSPDAPSVA